MLNHQVEPAAQDIGSLFGSQRTPGRQGAVSGVNRFAGFICPHFRYATQLLTVGGIGHRDGLAAVGVTPVAVDQCLLAK